MSAVLALMMVSRAAVVAMLAPASQFKYYLPVEAMFGFCLAVAILETVRRTAPTRFGRRLCLAPAA